MKRIALKAYADALALGLDMKLDLTDEQVVFAYNGCGAEWMSEEARSIADKLSVTARPAICVHDCDFAFGDGTAGDFKRANERLESNGIICADARYAWWNPMRYIVRRQARLFAKICGAFGWSAYLDAVSKRRNWEKTKGDKQHEQE